MTTATVVVCVYTEKRWDDIVGGGRRPSRRRTSRRSRRWSSSTTTRRCSSARRPSSPDVRVLANAHVQGLSGARNTAIAAAKGDVVVFLDDDAARPARLARRAARARTRTPPSQAVGGVAHPRWPTWPNGGRRPPCSPARTRPTATPPASSTGSSAAPTPASRPTQAEVRNLMGCNMSFRREVFERVGGFAEDIGRIGQATRWAARRPSSASAPGRPRPAGARRSGSCSSRAPRSTTG